jgi:hypothetical protein
VVGHVQSGKTLSFTTVASLARDNGLQLIVVIAGTTNVLLTQSRKRLRNDLRLDDGDAYDRWRRIDVDMNVTSEALASRMNACLDQWRDERVQANERATLLVTVLKNWQDLRHLTVALGKVNLRGVTGLLIDDEADQASLNSRVRQGQESSTYQQLRLLRSAMGPHTLLQYTATPQAPLLITIADSLSPDFCFLLTPGDDYLDGSDLFFEGSPYVRLLEGPLADPGEPVAAPPGLIQALMSFVMGAAVARGLVNRPRTRSMLIHPSRRIEPHDRYRNWVNKIRENWLEILGRDDGDLDKTDLMAMFEGARRELERTTQPLPPTSALEPALVYVLRNCQTEVLNAAPGGSGIREIPWSDSYAWVLVGGQLLDRGFTVEGLTVTYMSRPLGGGQADTLWQRARFLGYRKPYRDFIRIFIDRDTDDAFTSYVKHEQQMRRELSTIVREGTPLREWRRRFLLDRRLSATRAQVLRTLPKRVTVSDGWLEQRYPHHVRPVTITENDRVLKELIDSIEMRPNSGDARRTNAQKHLVGRISLRDVFDKLLTRYEVEDESDAARFSGFDCQLGLYLDRPGTDDEEALMVVMRGGTQSRRKLDDSDGVEQLFQGASVEDPRIYGGDRSVHEDALTIQIHRLELHTADDRTVAAGLPTLAIWVPGRMAADIVVQADEVD